MDLLACQGRLVQVRVEEPAGVNVLKTNSVATFETVPNILV